MKQPAGGWSAWTTPYTQTGLLMRDDDVAAGDGGSGCDLTAGREGQGGDTVPAGIGQLEAKLISVDAGSAVVNRRHHESVVAHTLVRRLALDVGNGRAGAV